MGDGADSGTHFHIRWSPSRNLDWERFTTRAEAETSAQGLLKPGESYTVEQFDGSCIQCSKMGLRERHDS